MKKLLIAALLAAPALAQADYTVEMRSISAQGIGAPIGTIAISEGPTGEVVFKPKLKGLPQGERGFHVHETASCGPAAKDGKPSAGESAGPHWDPNKAGKHARPAAGGHRGDLPALRVNADGTANTTVPGRGLKLADLRGKSLMIHAGGDNYADSPKPNGGGGDRIACGLVK